LAESSTEKKENIFFGNVKKISTFALPNGTKLKGGNEEREKQKREAAIVNLKLKKPKGDKQDSKHRNGDRYKVELRQGDDKVLLRSNM